jgi:hypothetical protein
VAGISVPTTWDFEVTNVSELPEAYLKPREPNTVMIRAQVKALKGDTNIPGVRVFETASVSVRRK